MTLSITEAEYVTLAHTIEEVMILQNVWDFILRGLGARCLRVFEGNPVTRQLYKIWCAR